MNLENLSDIVVPIILALITGGSLSYFFLPKTDYLKGKDEWIKKLEDRLNLVEAKAIENQEKVIVLEYKVDCLVGFVEKAPNGHDFLIELNKKVDIYSQNTNQNVYMRPQTSERVRVEFGGWIVLVVGIICLTLLVFFMILNDGTKKQMELEKAQIELQQKQLQSKN